MDYSAKSVAELKQICINNNIKGISGKSKTILIKMIEEYNEKNTNIETPENTTLQSFISMTELLNFDSSTDFGEYLSTINIY